MFAFFRRVRQLTTRWMQPHWRMIGCGIVFWCMSASGLAQSVDYVDELLMGLLSSSAPQEVLLGVKLVHAEKRFEPRCLDLIAEQMAQHDTIRTGAEADHVAWLAKTLGQSSLRRYSTFLDTMETRHVHEKVLKYLRAFRSSTLNGDAEPFVAGTHSLSSVHAVHLAQAEALRKPSGAPDFSKVRPGDALAKVLEVLGFPDDHGVKKRSKRFWGLAVSLSFSDLEMFYSEQGFIQFHNQSGTRVLRTLPFLKPPPDNLDGLTENEENILFRLLVDDNMEARKAAKSLAKNPPQNTVLLDVMADRIWLKRGSGDDFEIDALAHLCRALGNSGNTRYLPFLEHIAGSKIDGKLRGHAAAAAEALRQRPRSESIYQAPGA